MERRKTLCGGYEEIYEPYEPVFWHDGCPHKLKSRAAPPDCPPRHYFACLQLNDERRYHNPVFLYISSSSKTLPPSLISPVSKIKNEKLNDEPKCAIKSIRCAPVADINPASKKE